MKYLANHVKNGVLHFAFESAESIKATFNNYQHVTETYTQTLQKEIEALKKSIQDQQDQPHKAHQEEKSAGVFQIPCKTFKSILDNYSNHTSSNGTLFSKKSVFMKLKTLHDEKLITNSQVSIAEIETVLQGTPLVSDFRNPEQIRNATNTQQLIAELARCFRPAQPVVVHTMTAGK